MPVFYKKSEFRFTNRSNEYVIKMVEHLFEKKMHHDLYSLIPNSFLLTPPGQELRIYLKSCNLKINKVQAFLSNNDEWFQGNPHIDLTPGVNPRIVQCRLNVLVIGNPEDRMYWWNTYNSLEQLELKEFTYYNGTTYKSFGVKGNTIEERWNSLGEPSYSVSHILCQSAFVKTNCVHTVNVSKGPRLVLTVEVDKDLEDIG